MQINDNITLSAACYKPSTLLTAIIKFDSLKHAHARFLGNDKMTISVLRMLVEIVGYKKSWYVSARQVAAFCMCCERTAREKLKNLVKMGFIKRVRRNFGCYQYSIAKSLYDYAMTLVKPLKKFYPQKVRQELPLYNNSNINITSFNKNSRQYCPDNIQMTIEQIAYCRQHGLDPEKELRSFQKKNTFWQSKFSDWREVLWKWLAKSVIFSVNNRFLTKNCKNYPLTTQNRHLKHINIAYANKKHEVAPRDYDHEKASLKSMADFMNSLPWLNKTPPP